MKKITVKLIAQAEEEFIRLNKIVGKEVENGIINSKNNQLLKSVKRASELLKQNPRYGIQIRKKLIPKFLPVDNLWKVNLTGYWRMLYTLKGTELEIICFILEICDHKKYNRIFGYKKR